MCATSILTLYLCFSLPVAATAPQGMAEAFDHYHPGQLNQSALVLLRDGDDSTARVLLERAALLAPHDPPISGNLAELRSYREASLPIILRRHEAPSAETAKTAPADDLPALWPPKPQDNKAR